MPTGYSNPFSNIYTDAYNDHQSLGAPQVQGYIRPDGRLTYSPNGLAAPPVPTSPTTTPSPTTPTPTQPTAQSWVQYSQQLMQWLANGGVGPPPALPNGSNNTNNNTGSNQGTPNAPNSDRPANMWSQEVGSWVGAGGLGGTGQGTSSGDQTSTDAPSAQSTANPQSNMGHPNTAQDMSNAHTQSVQNVVDNPQMAQVVGLMGMALSQLDPLGMVTGIGNKANDQLGLPNLSTMATNPNKAQQMAIDYMNNLSQNQVQVAPVVSEPLVNMAPEEENDNVAVTAVAPGVGVGSPGVAESEGEVGDPNNAGPAGAVGMAAAGEGGGDGGSGDSVICTELHRQGYISNEVYNKDAAFAQKHVAQSVINGYHVWGKPIARLMRKSKTVTKIANQLIRVWTDTIILKPSVYSLVGVVVIPVGLIVCAVLGALVNPRNIPELQGAA